MFQLINFSELAGKTIKSASFQDGRIEVECTDKSFYHANFKIEPVKETIELEPAERLYTLTTEVPLTELSG